MTRRPMHPPHHRGAARSRLTDRDIELLLLELIEAYVPEPEPVILWLTDRIASHDIVARLQTLPARALNEPLTRGGGQRA